MREENVVVDAQQQHAGRKMPSARVIEDWLIVQICPLLGCRPEDIDVREPFASYGMSSMAAVSLTADLEDWLGVSLSPTLAWDYTTIELLARHLSEEAAAQ